MFVDTSGLLAVLDRNDSAHARCAAVWKSLLESEHALVTSSYVLVEVFALAQSRLGVEAVRALDSTVVPLLSVSWVDAELHARGMAALLTAGRRRLSLVDCVSFEAMRAMGIDSAFTVDRHFAERGFQTVP